MARLVFLRILAMIGYWIMVVTITALGVGYIQCRYADRRKVYKFLGVMIWWVVVGIYMGLWRLWFDHDIPFWDNMDMVCTAIVLTTCSGLINRWSKAK